jgi:hypothetical protein
VLIEAETELVVECGAAGLEQEINVPSGPSHLSAFVLAAVDQEVGGAFVERGANPKTSTMALCIVDHLSARSGQIAVDLAQSCPPPLRQRSCLALGGFNSEGVELDLSYT